MTAAAAVAATEGLLGPGPAAAARGGDGCPKAPTPTPAAPTPATPLAGRHPDAPPSARWPRRIWRQHLAALLANISSFGAGLALGWSSPALPALQNGATALRPSTAEASWVVSMVPLGALLGALPAGALADRLGRRGALLALAPPTLLGWLFITFAADSLAMLDVGRLLTGIGVGATSAAAALYCEEIADVAVRGTLGTYQYLMICAGVLCMYAVGAYTPYLWYTAASAVVPVLFAVTFCWMPESPVYLAAVGRADSARAALRWLRGPAADVERELKDIQASQLQSEDSRSSVTFASLWTRSPLRSTTLRAFLISLALMFFQQMSGISAFTFYTVQIFQEAGGSISSHTSTIIIGSIHLLAVFLPTLFVDRVGRRFLLLLSTAVSTLCLLALAVYSYLKSCGYDVGSWSWLPLASLVLFAVVFTSGMGPLPWFIMAELLPVHAKGWASPAVVCVNRTVTFVVTKQFPLMLEVLGHAATYGVFCGSSLLGAIFVAMCVPETKGRTKAEIQEALGGDRP